MGSSQQGGERFQGQHLPWTPSACSQGATHAAKAWGRCREPRGQGCSTLLPRARAGNGGPAELGCLLPDPPQPHPSPLPAAGQRPPGARGALGSSFIPHPSSCCTAATSELLLLSHRRHKHCKSRGPAPGQRGHRVTVPAGSCRAPGAGGTTQGRAGQGSPRQNQAQVLQSSSQQQLGTAGGCRAREGVGKTGEQRCQASCHAEHTTLPQTAGTGSPTRQKRRHQPHAACSLLLPAPCSEEPALPTIRAPQSWQRKAAVPEQEGNQSPLGSQVLVPFPPPPSPAEQGLQQGGCCPRHSPASSSVTETVKHPGICLSPFLISCILSNFEIHFPPKSWFSYLLFDHNEICLVLALTGTQSWCQHSGKVHRAERRTATGRRCKKYKTPGKDAFSCNPAASCPLTQGLAVPGRVLATLEPGAWSPQHAGRAGTSPGCPWVRGEGSAQQSPESLPCSFPQIMHKVSLS